MFSNKKAISELIATVLLISMALAMSGATYAWLKFYTSNPFPTESCPEITIVMEDYRNNCNNKTFMLNVKNRGNFNIDGFIVRITNGSGTFAIANYSIEGRSYLRNYVSAKLGPSNASRGIFNYTIYNRINTIELEAIRGFDQYGRPILCENSLTKQNIPAC